MPQQSLKGENQNGKTNYLTAICWAAVDDLRCVWIRLARRVDSNKLRETPAAGGVFTTTVASKYRKATVYPDRTFVYRPFQLFVG